MAADKDAETLNKIRMYRKNMKKHMLNMGNK